MAEIMNKGASGRQDASVRSDLFVSVESRDSGGLDLVIRSKVGAFYGPAIRESVTGILQAFGVQNAHVEIDDRGALPFVIEARLETALRQAGFDGEARPDRMFTRKGATAKDRLRRSRLYLPGNQPKLMVNAGLHKPDGVILDLEDSVHPDEKDAARLIVRNALRCIDFMGAERMVRINQLPLGLEDLDAIVPEEPDLILVPKVETADEILAIQDRIDQVQNGGDKIWLMPILESALGIQNAFSIATATDTIVALTIGLEDYTADLGVRKTVEGGESLYARSRMMNAARAAGIQAIDSVFGDVGDMEGLSRWAERSRALGYEGMGCIHPRQIKPIHEAFAPSEAEIEKAQQIVAAFDVATSRGQGVVSLGSKMIDPPVVLRAQRLVETAHRVGLIKTEEA